MNHLLRIARRLFGAKHKVKLLSLVLAFFSVWAHGETNPDKIAYGPYVTELAALWLPDYLDATLLAYGYINHLQPPEEASRMVHPKSLRRVKLLKDLYDLASQFRTENFKARFIKKQESSYYEAQINKSKRIQFRAGGDKIFDLPGKPPRMAVTGTSPQSDVIFNLGLISNPKSFTFSEALGLWMHELGHKFPEKDYSQEEIDEAAGLIARRYADQMRIERLGEHEILILNPVPPELEGSAHMSSVRTMGLRISSLFGVIDGANVYDLSPTLNRELDSFSHPQSNKLEVVRTILDFTPLQAGPEGPDVLIHFRTTRFPKKLDFYTSEDMGPNFHKSARVHLSNDLGKLSVSRYQNEPSPRELIRDAEAEFDSPGLSPDGKELQFFFHLHLKNQTHFHAAGFPDDRFQINALLDGEPVSVEARVTYRSSKLTHGMPTDVYKIPFTKEGRVRINIESLHGKELELIGMEDRFFTLGRTGYEGPEGDLKRILLTKSLKINLPGSGCEALLKP